jgi:hypothetical protein
VSSEAPKLPSCGRCGTPFDLWLVDEDGGKELWACTKCLAGEWSNLAAQLLEKYSKGEADDLRRAMERSKQPPPFTIKDLRSKPNS